MKTNDFSPEDSIRTIEKALHQAKAKKTGATFYYLLWGSLLTLHFILLYLGTKYPEAGKHLPVTLAWAVFPLGGLLSYLKSKKDNKRETALSLYEKVYLYAFGGFALAYGTMFFAASFTQPSLHNTLYSLLLGLTVFVVGGITKHSISVIGGVAGIACAGVSLNVPPDMQYLLAAVCSFTSCVVPGLLMKNSNV